ncbi:MAG TPA: ABC transporter ATP-binding protein [Pirellulales bacterium]|nr:ABC transporter ATP-binding protein [Pirellulales bacterium]
MAKIKLQQVDLTFDIRKNVRVTLKEFLVRGLFRHSVNPRMRVRALNDVNLALDEGDRVGIIGHNGAGKSTLLRLLAGIYPPTKGKRLVDGQISSLFDIALGFESEATGWENIYYRSYLQGETPRTIKDKIQPIAEFSELGDFLDMPVRHYSSGMSVRLAFSIATAIEPEILLVDEVLSAGDMAFQEKARRRMQEMMVKAKIIVMVSHDLTSIARLCDRAIWLDHGTIRADGPAAHVIKAYTTHVNRPSKAVA